MNLASAALPLGDERPRLLQYLNSVALPFSTVAEAIVKEYLPGEQTGLLLPSLVLWAGKAAGGAPADAMAVAAAFALLDRFMVLHDELVEGEEGSGAVARWGLGQSLNAGDALFALALRTLAEDVVEPARRLAVAELVVRRAMDAIEGRNIDVGRRGDAGLFERARSMRRRSAAMSGAAMASGALLGGLDAGAVRSYDRAGSLLGAAAAVPDAQLARRLAAKALAAGKRCTPDLAAYEAFAAIVHHVAARNDA